MAFDIGSSIAVNEPPVVAQDAPGPEGSSRPLHPAVFITLGVLLPAVLAYYLATSNELRVFAVVLGLVGIGAVFARPYWGLLLFIGLLYVRPEETFPELAGLRLTLVISTVVFLGMLLRSALQRERLVSTPTIAMMAGYSTILVLSTLNYGNTSEAAEVVAKLFILVLLIFNLIREAKQYDGLVTALIVCTTYLSVYSIYLFMTGGALVQGDGAVRAEATGIFGDPNDLAATICAGLALTLTRATLTVGLRRIGCLLLSACMLWAVFLTNSRGGMLALLTVLLGACILYSKHKQVAILIAVLLGGVLLVAGPSRMTKFDNQEESANMRFWFWDNGVQQLLQHPLLGVGYDQFQNVNDGHVAHNSFVQVFSEIGLPGYILWMALAYCAFRGRSRASEGSEGTTVGPPIQEALRKLAGARLGLASYLVAGFFISRTATPVMYILMALPVAAQLAHSDSLPAHSAALPRIQSADWRRIISISLSSIFFIWAFAQHNK